MTEVRPLSEMRIPLKIEMDATINEIGVFFENVLRLIDGKRRFKFILIEEKEVV